MAFDQKTRNLLQRTITACRRVFDREFTAQLQELYGIQPDGTLTLLSELEHLADEELEIASLLRSRINHLEGGEPSEALTRTHAKPESVARVIREQAFTVLNRLAALRLCEERGLVLECVRQGVNSEGFRLFMTTVGNALGETHEGYLVFLHCLFDELALDLGVLFDRFSPLALLFPRKDALEEVLRELNGSGKAAENEDISAEQFADIWNADEAIGWIYQYYNDEAERKKMREAPAPRNSRELAVRNQFFTPRYVVEFLTDNTLGRLWYEMTHGETALGGRCHYLVRRPTEVFLKAGEVAPASTAENNRKAGEDLSQDALLRQPVHIPHRPLKDPREILLLDPACGSMHFGLYAFDLLTIIYDEAWEIAHGPDDSLNSNEGFAEFVVFADTFPDKPAFLLEVPRLIIEHNIHGIDIDPRAAQIAGLSLWLRAQRGWHEAGIKPADRPRITRTHIVCAEPMPGEKKLLREFVEQQFDIAERPAFSFLLEKIFDRMALAGEAGSLLRIEEEIRSAISEASALARSQPLPRQAALFSGDQKPEPKQLELQGIVAEHFWQEAEQRIYDALEAYAEQVERNDDGFQRRLFANDAAQGFAFIDLCRKHYDVAVMNPPFGEASLGSRVYLYEVLPETSRDLFAGFVTRFNKLLLPGGRLGVLSNRTAFYSDFLARWRDENFLGEVASLSVFADLGYGVLDAVVEAAAYVASRQHLGAAEFINALGAVDKAEALLNQISAIQSGHATADSCIRDIRIFERFPDHRFIYQLHSFWASKLNLNGDHSVFSSRSGLTTGDDPRLLRLSLELPPNQIGDRWRWVAKGGEFARYRTDLHLLADWKNRHCFVRMRNQELYGKRGVTYTERTTSNLSARVLNEGSCFSVPGPGIIPKNPAQLHFLLAYINSFAAGYAIEALIGGGDFSIKGTAARHLEPGYMKHLPEVVVSADDAAWFSDRVNALLRLLETVVSDETDPLFKRMQIQPAESLSKSLERSTREAFERFKLAYGIIEGLEQKITALLQIPDDRIRDTYSDTGWPWAQEMVLPDVDHSVILSADPFSPRSGVPAGDFGPSNHRFQMKLSHYLHAGIERYAAFRKVSPIAVCELLTKRAKTSPSAVAEYAAAAISYLFGVVFGRWDIRYAIGDIQRLESADPFAPLPACPPGMLQAEDELPLSPEAGSRLRAEGRYPVDIAWDGILVEDPEHPLDFERQLRAALAVLWTDHADTVEREACELLGVPTLREWFRRPACFFADHLTRYSKSRRQAPIYWPISGPSGRYGLWLYYHRLTPDTLYKCLQQFVVPKLVDVEKELTRLRTVLASNEGGAKERSRLEELEALRRELIELRAELELWAPKWKPNLNDGVLINAAPLWKLFRFPKWQKDLKECWKELEKGDYDWAHLAYSLWPDRVREKCKTDRSIAIAHGLEAICEVKAPVKKVKKTKKKATKDDLQEFFEG